MTTEEVNIVNGLLAQGLGYRRIAGVTGLPLNSVKTYCRRHKEELTSVAPMVGRCRMCGTPVAQTPKHRARLFCSDSCRMRFWNSHRDLVKHKNTYSFICPFCGKEFISLGRSNRKYCSRACADKGRRKGAMDSGD